MIRVMTTLVFFMIVVSMSGYAGAEGGLFIPSIPGVPKIFLPDIGIGGDFAYERNSLSSLDPRYDPSKVQPRIRDGQVAFFSPIDPFTNAQFTVDIPENGNANIEESWIHFTKLPGNISLRVGRYLPQFGLLDLLNTFQLPMLNRPNAIGNYIGSDGMIGTGGEINFFIPNPWDLNLQMDLNALRGDILGGTSSGTDLSYLATLDYSRDLFRTGSLQSGVSLAQAPSPVGLSEILVNPYLHIIYAPIQRRVWTWMAEGMFAGRKGLGPDNTKAGFYSFLDYNFALRYHLGFVFDSADRAIAPYGYQVSFGPNVTWFVSDNTRLRLQYTHVTAGAGLDPEDIGSLQVTFSLGNLKQMK